MKTTDPFKEALDEVANMAEGIELMIPNPKLATSVCMMAKEGNREAIRSLVKWYKLCPTVNMLSEEHGYNYNTESVEGNKRTMNLIFKVYHEIKEIWDKK